MIRPYALGRHRRRDFPLFPLACGFVVIAFAVLTARTAAQPALTNQQVGDPLRHEYIPAERIQWHVADPTAAAEEARAALEKARQANHTSAVTYQERVLEGIASIQRDRQVRLTLEDVVRRTLANNFSIKIAQYDPAINTALIVQAEAFFDAVFLTSVNRANIDRPSGSQLTSTDVDQTNFTTGITKLLPTGATVSGRYNLRRTKQAFAFQLVNPEYFSAFTLELQQPLLRDFGLDFNHSLIVQGRILKDSSELVFRQQAMDTLREVEDLYWRLMQARRDVVITAKLVAEFEEIYEYLVARQGFDITPVQIEATKADLELARADFISRRSAVLNLEDELLSRVNDPALNLVDHPELIPVDIPILQELIVDPVSEVQTALNHRTEIQGFELLVAKLKIDIDRERNAELPRFDLTFSATYDGLASNADRSFDKMTAGNFIEYFVGVVLETPIGNRGPRARRREAELKYAQEKVKLQKQIEDVIREVNLAVRGLETSYDLIAPTFESAEARESEVRSIVAREERKDFNTLINELSARQRLVGIRRSMLDVMVDYNVAIINLERAKGTLLEYNNVVLPADVRRP